MTDAHFIDPFKKLSELIVLQVKVALMFRHVLGIESQAQIDTILATDPALAELYDAQLNDGMTVEYLRMGQTPDAPDYWLAKSVLLATVNGLQQSVFQDIVDNAIPPEVATVVVAFKINGDSEVAKELLKNVESTNIVDASDLFGKFANKTDNANLS